MANESLVLDGLQLNGGALSLESMNHTPAPKRPEWISGADSDGAILAGPPRSDDCVWELRLRISQQATMDAALAQVAAILDKLQECERNGRGLALVHTPATATLPAVTWRALLGECTSIPKTWSGDDVGWFAFSPVMDLRLTCLPFGEGTEYQVATVTSSDIMQTLELASVPGDVPALGRLVVTEGASQSRRFAQWGLESRWYPTATPPALIIDSPTMMETTGYAGATTKRTGAYSGTENNVIRATLGPQVQAICGLGNLTHVGSFRPHLRFHASATTMAVRLTFQALDGPLRSLSYRVPVSVGWNYIDLGLVSIPQAALGAQRWTGRIEAYSTATGGEFIDIDVMLLVPAEAYGRARAEYVYSPGVLAGYDYFTDITAGTVLGGRVAPSGGSWATSGEATDFAAADGPDLGQESISRTTPTGDVGDGRSAVLGATSYTDLEVGVTIRGDYPAAAGRWTESAILARYVDSSNYCSLTVRVDKDPTTTLLSASLRVHIVVAGVKTLVASTGVPVQNEWRRLRLLVTAGGKFVGDLLSTAGASQGSLVGVRAEMATGGALATGKPGVRAVQPETVGTLYFDDFYLVRPPAEPIALHSGRTIEFRHDATLRQDSTGTYAGPPPEYVGSRFFIPPAGGPGRKARIAVVAKRNDVATSNDDHIADALTVTAWATPRYLAVPR